MFIFALTHAYLIPLFPALAFLLIDNDQLILLLCPPQSRRHIIQENIGSLHLQRAAKCHIAGGQIEADMDIVPRFLQTAVKVTAHSSDRQNLSGNQHESPFLQIGNEAVRITRPQIVSNDAQPCIHLPDTIQPTVLRKIIQDKSKDRKCLALAKFLKD